MILDIGQNSKFKVKKAFSPHFPFHLGGKFLMGLGGKLHPPCFSSSLVFKFSTKQNNGKLPFYIIISPSSPFSAQLIIP